MASQMPGTRIRKTLILLGLIVLIIHCRPWSYALFEPASENERDVVPRTGSLAGSLTNSSEPASCGRAEKNLADVTYGSSDASCV
jgi:hypothetical protein